jgi:ankyrin repeat protein
LAEARAARDVLLMHNAASKWESYKQTMVVPVSLWSAAKANDVPEHLLDQGSDIDARDSRGYSPLMLAAYSGNAEAFEYLLGRGANPNSTDAAGNSVLMGAAFKGHLAMVQRLLAAGADLHARNHAGLDAQSFAQNFGRTEIVRMLSALSPHDQEVSS